MKSVIVGYDDAAKIHELLYPKDVEIIGIVDTNSQKTKLAKKEGYRIFNSIESAVDEINPDFWDICTPKSAQQHMVKVLLKKLNTPNILIDRLVTTPKDMSNIVSLTEKFQNAKVSVNENYISSRTTQKVKELIQKYNLKKLDISIEFSKNRTQDFLSGRYLDNELGALGYEGPHMIACVSGLGEGYHPKEIKMSELSPLKLPEGKARNGKNILERQGYGGIEYVTRNDSHVIVHTYMNGHNLVHSQTVPETKSVPNPIPADDTSTRYRVIRVRNSNSTGGLPPEGLVEIFGIYEPTAKVRNLGKVYEDAGNLEGVRDKVFKVHELQDNSMNQHLTQIVEYFKGNRGNPSSVTNAATIVNFLAEAAQKAIIPKYVEK